jgi:hypothetical protein
MAFTTRTITHVFTNADGTAASGSITFWLTQRMTNSGTSVMPAQITANLDSNGNLSQSLYCNDDTDTTPTGAQWRVDLRILGAEQESFFISVPSGSGSVDLGTLLPSSQQVG